MKRMVISLLVLLTAMSIVTTLPVHAQQPVLMTDGHIAQIKNNCTSALATLTQIKTNDGLVYVNRNQTYFSISDKLIARLNSRLALNKYDNSSLVKIAGTYNAALTNFRTVYNDYSRDMAELAKMNCSLQPVGFYDKVAEVRAKREIVHGAVAKLHTIIGQYRTALDVFKVQNAKKLGIKQ